MLQIFDILYDDIGVIRELWEKNRLYHENTSEHFKESYHFINFDERMKAFDLNDKETLKITVAKKNDKYIGYCISTIINDVGELQSLHIDESFRGNGAGMQLVTKHIEWLKEKHCKTIGVTVSQENHNTIMFYKRLGFFPNTLYMEMK